VRDRETNNHRGFWQAFLAALAACTGCSLRRHPLPELREVGHEWLRAHKHRG
jgi:hypothetical protein